MLGFAFKNNYINTFSALVIYGAFLHHMGIDICQQPQMALASNG